MFRVTSFVKEARANKIWIRDDNDPDIDRVHVLLDGHLEAYMGAYGLAAGAALTLLLADGHVPAVECPELSDPDCARKVAKIMRDVPKLFDWSAVDRDEILSRITLADDKAADMVNAWAVIVADARDEVGMSHGEVQEMTAERASAYAAGHQRRQEELLGDDMVGEIMADKKAGYVLQNDPGNVASVQRHDDTLRVEY